jgi:hypothetical protein
MRKVVVHILPVSVLFVLFCRCNQDSITQGSNSLHFISKSTIGCIQDLPISGLSNEVVLTWQYNNGDLRLYINVHTRCNVQYRDSVKIVDNNITILLADTVASVAECACIYREEYRLQVNGYQDVFLSCSIRSYGEDDYKLNLPEE